MPQRRQAEREGTAWYRFRQRRIFDEGRIVSLLEVLHADGAKRMPMSANRSKSVGLQPMPLELGVAVVTQGLYDIPSQKKRFAFRWAVNRMTIVTDERQVAVMA